MRHSSGANHHLFGNPPSVASFVVVFIAYLLLVANPSAWLVPAAALLAAVLVASSISRWFHAHVVPRARRSDPKSTLHI